MFISALAKRIAHHKSLFLLVFAGISLACLTSLVLLGLNAFGYIGLPASQGPRFAATPTPATAAGNAVPGALPGCLNLALSQTGKVVEVVDGDTIRVLLPMGVETVRYTGIDTPEVTRFVTILGHQAYDRNAELVLGNQVTLYPDVEDSDRNGRLLRYVFVGDVFINQQLVSEGLAEEQPYEPNVACRAQLLDSENSARDQGLGIWQLAKNRPAGPLSNPPSQTIGGHYLPGSILISNVDKQKEVVTLTNNSDAEINLQGWYLVSERGDQLCELNGRLPAGQSIDVFSQRGSNGISCNAPSAVWSNSAEDPAALYDPAGTLIDRR